MNRSGSLRAKEIRSPRYSVLYGAYYVLYVVVADTQKRFKAVRQATAT
jgi:hypothetical protein